MGFFRIAEIKDCRAWTRAPQERTPFRKHALKCPEGAIHISPGQRPGLRMGFTMYPEGVRHLSNSSKNLNILQFSESYILPEYSLYVEPLQGTLNTTMLTQGVALG